MKKEITTCSQAPAAIGPYSQGVSWNGLLFLSGQLGMDPETGLLREDLEGQAEQIFTNIEAILAHEGLDMTHILKATVFLTDMNQFATVNRIYEQRVPAPYPARSAFAVAALPKGALVEIEVIVHR